MTLILTLVHWVFFLIIKRQKVQEASSIDPCCRFDTAIKKKYLGSGRAVGEGKGERKGESERKEEKERDREKGEGERGKWD